MFPASQDGLKPIQVAASRGYPQAVEILFPLTSKVETIPNWTIDGILEFMQSDRGKKLVLIKILTYSMAMYGLEEDVPTFSMIINIYFCGLSSVL
jgi:hypothetical protein